MAIEGQQGWGWVSFSRNVACRLGVGGGGSQLDHIKPDSDWKLLWLVVHSFLQFPGGLGSRVQDQREPGAPLCPLSLHLYNPE